MTLARSCVKRIWLCVLIGCLAALLFLPGCSRQTTDSKTKVMFTITDTDEAFRRSLKTAVQDEAEALGIELDIRYAGGSKDAQTDAVLAANRENFDVVICFPVDPGDVLELEEAAGDMPIVFVNNKPSDDVLTKNHYMYVGCEETDAGKMQAEYVWDKLNHPTEMKAALFKGEPGHSGTIGRTTAVKDFFEEKGVAVEWVYEDYAHWSDTEAADKFTIFLNREIPFDAVFSNNDSMATGIISVMLENGLDPKVIPVVGVDATAAGCRSIKDGGMSFTVFQNGRAEGSTAVRLAKKLAEDNTAEGFEDLDEDGQCVWIPYEPVDITNVDQYIAQ